MPTRHENSPSRSTSCICLVGGGDRFWLWRDPQRLRSFETDTSMLLVWPPLSGPGRQRLRRRLLQIAKERLVRSCGRSKLWTVGSAASELRTLNTPRSIRTCASRTTRFRRTASAGSARCGHRRSGSPESICRCLLFLVVVSEATRDVAFRVLGRFDNPWFARRLVTSNRKDRRCEGRSRRGRPSSKLDGACSEHGDFCAIDCVRKSAEPLLRERRSSGTRTRLYRSAGSATRWSQRRRPRRSRQSRSQAQ